MSCAGHARMIEQVPRKAKPGWLPFVLRWISWLAVGCALVLVAGFVELSEELLDTEEPSSRLSSVDAAVLRFVLGVRVPWLNGVAMDLTALGSPVVVALVTIATAALLAASADRRGVTALVVSSFASAPLTMAMKSLIDRPRPDVIPPLVSVTGLSYPSGHALAAAATYLTAAFVVARHLHSPRQRIATIGFAGLLVLLIGGSRVYLGVHYPSDVFGGMLLGTAWALGMAAVLRRVDGLKSRRCEAPRSQSFWEGGRKRPAEQEPATAGSRRDARSV
jgi:undecaprenyl-diphosphatase